MLAASKSGKRKKECCIFWGEGRKDDREAIADFQRGSAEKSSNLSGGNSGSMNLNLFYIIDYQYLNKYFISGTFLYTL